VRPHHAEVEVVEQAEGLLSLRGLAVSPEGRPVTEDLRLVAMSRRADSPEWASTTIQPSTQGAFQVSLDLDDLAGRRVTRHDDWDLYLEQVATGERARLARLADDIPDRKSVVHYGFTLCDVGTDPRWAEESPVPAVQVQPYITVDSDLSLYIRDR
jgi:hypothetical protein